MRYITQYGVRSASHHLWFVSNSVFPYDVLRFTLFTVVQGLPWSGMVPTVFLGKSSYTTLQEGSLVLLFDLFSWFNQKNHKNPYISIRMIAAEHSPVWSAFLLPPLLAYSSLAITPRMFTTSCRSLQGQGNRMQDIPPTTCGVTSILHTVFIQ